MPPYHPSDLDRLDPLAGFRSEFAIGESGPIYLDGNSLGRMPRRTAALIREVTETQWGERLVRGWNEGWMDLASRIGGKIARLIGARADEAIVCDSTSVNLYKLAAAAMRARPGRRRIVTTADNFPSDLYVLGGLGEVVADGPIDATTALVSMTHTDFKSGETHDMAAVTRAAHEAGALVLWDLSHSAGAMPIDLNGCGADLAVGCTYKYLNGGPGSPAYIYVRRDLQEQLRSPIQGWFGQANPFGFEPGYEPAAGIARFLAGTPPILSMAAIEPGVDLLLEAGMERVRAKSVALTDYLIELWEEWLKPRGVTLNSPRDAARRGSHVSLGHPDAWRINRALIDEMNVIPDFRRPDNIRFGVAPLYTTFIEVHDAMERFRRVLEDRTHERMPDDRARVT